MRYKLSDEIKLLLEENNVTRFDISNYYHKRFKHIGKRKLKLMQLILENQLVAGKSIKSLLLNDNKLKKVRDAQRFIIIPGLKGKGHLIRVEYDMSKL